MNSIASARQPAVLPHGVERASKYALLTPGISTGYWNARKTPSRARLRGSTRAGLAVGHGPPGDFVLLVTGDDPRQRALAGAVGPHDGVNLAGVDRQIDAAEYFGGARTDVKVANGKHRLSDRSFEAHAQQLLRLDSELHRELTEDLLAEAADDQVDRVLGGQSALTAIEDLILADLRRGRLVLDLRRRVL